LKWISLRASGAADIAACGAWSTWGGRFPVCGWIQRQRNLGGLIFADVRDRTGLLQLAFDHTTPKEIFDKAFFSARGVCGGREGDSPGTRVQKSRAPYRRRGAFVTELRVLARAETLPLKLSSTAM
jgi:aspartyl-tRNA synthetase